jgi:hypothetical protein
MDDSLRRLLRSIALGLPLVVPGTGLLLTPTLLGCGTCDNRAVTTTDVRVAELSEGGEELVTCESVCRDRFGEAAASCSLDSPTQVSCSYERTEHQSCGAGRRADAPALVTRAGGRASDWLVGTAILEASAVTAFRRTARALSLHGAPRSLAQRALRAADDERRHTAAVARLAAETSHVSLAVRTDVREVPTLRALALENAREGCVGEAWGAIEAHAQAALAEDPRVRSLMGRIARDEARHALFSLDLDAWARRSRIDAVELDRARSEAHGRLVGELGARGASALGLPHGETAGSLAQLLAA